MTKFNRLRKYLPTEEKSTVSTGLVGVPMNNIRMRALVIVSYEAHNIREHCNRVGVLHAGKMHMFDDIDTAFTFYQEAVA